MIPPLLHMPENYLSTAFKTKNAFFFPAWFLEWIEHSPDAMVWAMAGIFILSWVMFALGLKTQLACLVMTGCCYYFYALNSFHIGTLSFDILLVTLVLLCTTSYLGDFLSLDSLRRGDVRSYKRLRPFFVQRLLQLQLLWTFWHTSISKITAGGNWLTENPYYYLMHYPPMGVVRAFPLRPWLAQHPEICYGLGIALVIFELTIPLGWFIPRTRTVAIVLGIAFQLMLWFTLHVPTIFLFLFPPMMMLFIPPERLVSWIEEQQEKWANRGRAILLYDGQCGFCVSSVRRLRVLDLFGWLDPLDFHRQPALDALHPSLTPARCHSEMILIESNGRLSGGFDAFARLSLRLPLLLGLAPLLRFPGIPWLGRRIYRWIAAHRYLFHRNISCETNQCNTRSFN